MENFKHISALPIFVAAFAVHGCGEARVASGGVIATQTKAPARPASQVTSLISRPFPEEFQAKADRIAERGTRMLAEAQRLFDGGNLGKAEAKCREVNQIFGSDDKHMDPGTAHLLGRIRMRQGRYADAVRLMAPNLQGNPVAELDLALCYAKVGDLRRAAAFYDPHLITDYNSAFGDTHRFLPRIRTGAEVEAALQWCKGVALSNVGRAGEATDCYAAARRVFPRNILLAARLGLAAENAGRPEEAAAAYGFVQRSGDAAMREPIFQSYRQTTAPAEARSTQRGMRKAPSP